MCWWQNSYTWGALNYKTWNTHGFISLLGVHWSSGPQSPGCGPVPVHVSLVPGRRERTNKSFCFRYIDDHSLKVVLFSKLNSLIITSVCSFWRAWHIQTRLDIRNTLPVAVIGCIIVFYICVIQANHDSGLYCWLHFFETCRWKTAILWRCFKTLLSKWGWGISASIIVSGQQCSFSRLQTSHDALMQNPPRPHCNLRT